MSTVWKYELEVVGTQTISVPRNAEWLCVQSQRGVLSLWVKLWDETKPKQDRHIEITGTGHALHDIQSLVYIGTVQVHGGDLVWHVWERLT